LDGTDRKVGSNTWNERVLKLEFHFHPPFIAQAQCLAESAESSGVGLMNSKLLVIVATSDKQKTLTAFMYTTNAIR
jgi:hypothetical protein